MQDLLEELRQLLVHDKRLFTEDVVLLRNLVVELGLKIDLDLLRLLLSHVRNRRTLASLGVPRLSTDQLRGQHT